MTTRRSLLRRVAAVTATVTAAVVLAACGTDDSAGHSGHEAGSSSSAPSSSAEKDSKEHNAQDVAFAQGMIPHHRQAVTMADLASSRAQSQDVKDLAAQIKKAQDPEISTMSGWLMAWGEKVPSSDMGGMDGMQGMEGMDHSGHGMPGMMSDAEMKKLKKLSGSAFDSAFLQMMIEHHNGAIDQAQTERGKGAYGPAKDLAASIIDSQSAEIKQMKQMLGK